MQFFMRSKWAIIYSNDLLVFGTQTDWWFTYSYTSGNTEFNEMLTKFQGNQKKRVRTLDS